MALSPPPITIVTGASNKGTFPGPASHIIRDFDGDMYVAISSLDTNPVGNIQVYVSTDDGATWAAESWSQNVGSLPASPSANAFQPNLMLAPDGQIWVCFKQESVSDVGVVAYRRDEASQTWIEEYGVTGNNALSNLEPIDAAPSLTARMDYTETDPFTSPAGQNHRIHACFTADIGVGYKEAYYANSIERDDEIVVPFRVANGRDVDQPVMALDPRGQVQIAFRMNDTSSPANAQLWYTRRVDYFQFTEPEQITTGSNFGIEVEDIRTISNGTPIILFRRGDVSGSPQEFRLYIAVRSAGTGQWNVRRVWDKTNDLAHLSAQFAVDRIDNPFIWARTKHTTASANNIFETTLWTLDSSRDWQFEKISQDDPNDGGNGRVSIPNGVLYEDHYIQGFQKPNRMQRGFAGIWWSKESGNRDLHFYTTSDKVFDAVVEEPPYRVGTLENLDRTSIVLSGEGAATETLPTVTQGYTYTESNRFVTNVHTFELKHKARIARFAQGRPVHSINFPVLTKTERDSLLTFLTSRKVSAEPFFYTLPDKQVDVKVALVPSSVQFNKIGPTSYSCEFEAEVLR